MEMERKTDRTETQSPARTKKKQNTNDSRVYSQKKLDGFVSPSPPKAPPPTAAANSTPSTNGPAVEHVKDGWDTVESDEDSNETPTQTNSTPATKAPSRNPSSEADAASDEQNPDSTDVSPEKNDRNVSFGGTETQEIPANRINPYRKKTKSNNSKPRKKKAQQQPTELVLSLDPDF